jgi:SAM-dependent methyltransferase
MVSWVNGIDSEIRYWNRYLNTWLNAPEKPPNFRDSFQRLADSLPVGFPQILPYLKSGGRVLDCGSSLASAVGNVLPNGETIELVPVDPLAPLYDVLLDKYKAHPYVRTKFAMVEFLDDIFAPASFDVACMTNALDHSYDPVLGIKQLLNMVAGGGGYVFLCHALNEAEHENYRGFHQWNMSFEGTDFIIWNKSEKRNITKMLNGLAEVSVDYGPYQGIPGNPNWLNVIIRKTTDELFDVRAEKAATLRFFVRALGAMTSRLYRETNDSRELREITVLLNGRLLRDWARQVLAKARRERRKLFVKTICSFIPRRQWRRGIRRRFGM